MSKTSKILLVVALYGAAFLAAIVTYYLCQLRAQMDPSLQASSGMSAFGDSLLILGVWGFASLVPTVLALFFLRSNGTFWRILSLASLALAATGPLSVLFMATLRILQNTDPQLQLLWHLGLTRLFAIPVLATGFAACALIAPDKPSRKKLLVAAAAEIGTGLYVLIHLALTRSFV